MNELRSYRTCLPQQLLDLGDDLRVIPVADRVQACLAQLRGNAAARSAVRSGN
jgi:hypothetical protein